MKCFVFSILILLSFFKNCNIRSGYTAIALLFIYEGLHI